MPDFEESPEHVWTLAEIFDRADKELVQVKLVWGDAERKQACANGAIAYYLSGGKTCSPWMLGLEQLDVWNEFRRTWFNKVHESIERLNNDENWTFKRFAAKARKLKV